MQPTECLHYPNMFVRWLFSCSPLRCKSAEKIPSIPAALKGLKLLTAHLVSFGFDSADSVPAHYGWSYHVVNSVYAVYLLFCSPESMSQGGPYELPQRSLSVYCQFYVRYLHSDLNVTLLACSLDSILSSQNLKNRCLAFSESDAFL